MKIKYILLWLFVLPTVFSSAQDEKLLTLDNVIDIASQQSLDAFINQNMYLSSYWEYRYFRADRLPSLSIEATPFDYNRSMQKVYNYDENRDEYKSREDLGSEIGLLLNQNVGLTGGRIFARSELNLTQKLGLDKISSYNSTPFSVGYAQTINGYNRLKWTAKIEPIKFERAKKDFIQSKEELAIKATRRFFDLVDAQIEVNIANTNMANADTLYKIGKGRFQVGTVTQDELLNLELSFMNATLALTRANLGLERSRADLNSFLSFDKETKVECIVPTNLPDLQIEADKAIQAALQNNPEILQQQQRLIEEDSKVKQAKSESGVSGDVYALYGLNQNAESIDLVYQDPLDRQRLRLGVNIPVLDWGRRKGRLAMAESSREVVRISVNQERIDFEQNIIMNVMEFNLQADQVLNTAKADTIAQMGYDVTQQRFLIGKVDVTKLNLARNDQERARRAYIAALRSYWNYYFTIRQLTLYDFENTNTLSQDFERLINNN
ncbi:MAG: TolC family protein [Prolixibacteraceae bacterium]|jgi:outer membrane protein TolC|nr:TolC family protein [Prolixibacteraceae bacterium]MBT6765131.1 TolC family protein [Prolixibacteraceae bacterium]MBT6999599.1 TolC family protein [Prolixibacteraceae bacterium]MBT7396890.1 TolC family protein [Prolixibacteraceae bacterium]